VWHALQRSCLHARWISRGGAWPGGRQEGAGRAGMRDGQPQASEKATTPWRKRSAAGAALDAADIGADATDTDEYAPPRRLGTAYGPIREAGRRDVSRIPLLGIHPQTRVNPPNQCICPHAVWDSVQKRKVSLGTFSNEEEAARAYDRASIVFHGTQAATNVRACM
jgi:hypothetical protein